MGKVNVVLPDGKVVSVDEETYLATKGSTLVHGQTIDEEDDARLKRAHDEKYSGVGPTLKAAAIGAADTMTFGGASVAAGVIGGEDFRKDLAESAEAHPVAYGVGALGGALVPFGAAELAGDIGRGVTEGVGRLGGVTESAGRLGAGEFAANSAGRFVEGAVFGAGGEVARTQLAGDPLTIEGFVEGAGLGGIMNVGIGAIADGLTNVGRKAAARELEETTARNAFQAELEDATQGERIFSNSGAGDSYETLREAVGGVEKRMTDEWKAVETANDKYDEFLGSREQWGKLRGEFSKAENKARESFAERKVNEKTIAREIEKTYTELHEFPEGPEGREWQGEVYPTMQDANAAHAAAAKEWKQGLDETIEVAIRNAKMPVGRTPEQVALARRALSDLAKRRQSAEIMWGSGDKAGALKALTDVGDDMTKVFGHEIPIPKVPEMPPVRYTLPEWQKMPKDLEALSRLRHEDWGKLAGRMDQNEPSIQAALERLVGDVGVKPLDNAPGTFSALAERLSAYRGSIDSLESRAAKAAAETAAKPRSPIMEWVVKQGKGMVRNAAGYKAFQATGGGWMGAAAGSLARGTVGSAMNFAEAKIMGLGNEDAALAAVMGFAKANLGSKIRHLVAKYAEPTARRLSRLGPVTSYLSTRFLSSEVDREKDPRKQTLNRIKEVMAAAQNAPDTSYAAVSQLGMLGHPADLGFKTHAHTVKAIQHLADTAPKDPGTAMSFSGESFWNPPVTDSMAWAHRYEAVLEPLKAIARMLSGDGHPAAVESLWYAWPATMAAVAEELVYAAPDVPLTRGGPGQILGLSTGTRNPVIATALQGHYLPQPEEGQGQGQGGSQSSGRPSGRPGAVGPNPVANTNVTALIGQQ